MTRTLAHVGGLDAAVANAGFTSGDSIGAGDPTLWSPMVLTNPRARPAAHATLPHLDITGGRLVPGHQMGHYRTR
ncbi:hypothetical protein [Streptomyces sp. NPDC046939]|uniref:hypothetical protein n=1 Tax=Streptomyces sp. NPDC046939 TaxID=3155376 RepID=UPI0033DA15C5